MNRWIVISVVASAGILSGCGSYYDTSYRPDAAASFQVGRLDEAEALCRQALDRAPFDPFALYYMGRISAARRNWENGIYYFQCCLDVEPGYYDARRWLIACKESAGLAGENLMFIPIPPARPGVVTYDRKRSSR